MPLLRFFLVTGAALLTLLLLFDWYQPTPAAVAAAGSDVDRTAIRIQSQHKWPRAVVYDTDQPTIVPAAVAAVEPPLPIEKAPEPAKPPMDALAMAQPHEPAAVPAPAAQKRVVRRAKARTPNQPPRVASYDLFGNAFKMDW